MKPVAQSHGPDTRRTREDMSKAKNPRPRNAGIVKTSRSTAAAASIARGHHALAPARAQSWPQGPTERGWLVPVRSLVAAWRRGRVRKTSRDPGGLGPRTGSGRPAVHK